MDENKNQLNTDSSTDDALEVSVSEPSIPARRRIFRQGASVVAVTLASRPVLAWHCQSPSAWGSEQLNPNTSLRFNDGHLKFADEGWYITDWANNTNSNPKVSGLPWAKLLEKNSALFDASTKTNGVFDYTKVSVGKLVSVFGITVPTGVSGTTTAVRVLKSGTSFQKAILAAQLNFVVLWALKSPFDIENCVSLPQLKLMASGSYTPMNGARAWGQEEITSYLINNWIVQ